MQYLATRIGKQKLTQRSSKELLLTKKKTHTHKPAREKINQEVIFLGVRLTGLSNYRKEG